VVHGDFHPGSVGWRMTGEGELVLFDFEDVMIDFLLCEVAVYLGAPDGVFPIKVAPVEDFAWNTQFRKNLH
jgi:Ser/Thr protein kinase RdoA (MazF antagonist)